jgi:hypothetical protein
MKEDGLQNSFSLLTPKSFIALVPGFDIFCPTPMFAVVCHIWFFSKATLETEVFHMVPRHLTQRHSA